MNKLRVSILAQRDLLEIKAYIANDLENPTAAISVVKKITQKIRGLKEHPLMGAPIASISNANSDERFLISGKYLIFYHVIEKDIFIDRVLYGGRDYLKILFQRKSGRIKIGSRCHHPASAPSFCYASQWSSSSAG